MALVAATTAWSTRRGMPQPGETLDFRGVHPDPAAGSTLFLERLTGSAAAVGLPLLVLSRVERGRALLLGALGFAPAELSGKRRVS